MGKRIISFSLWRDNPLYSEGAIANVLEAKEVYEGWICRFYVHHACRAMDILLGMDCEVVPMEGPLTDERGLFWRFWAASDPETEFVIIRDCDSRVSAKEAAAVQEWIHSGKDFHIMKDYPHGTGETILGGMWGVRGGVLPNIRTMIQDWVKSNVVWKYHDQHFLADIVWPIAQHKAFFHGPNHSQPSHPYPPHKPFKYGEYIGQVIPIGPKE
jgi:hypothetical protein